MPTDFQINSITIKQWGVEQFLTSKKEWSDLLNVSDADKLFLSWEWQYTWWNTFSEIHNLELTLLAAYNNNEDLIGIAPLYTIHTTIKKVINTTQLQFIGNICRGEETMRTEYIDFIVTHDNSTEIKRAFLLHINNRLTWDEFYFTDLRKDSDTYDLLTIENIRSNVYIRQTEEYKSYYIDTSGEFKNYLDQRGKNTRLSIYNRRKTLATKGNIKITKAKENEMDEHFDLLNKLHKERWGKPIFTHEKLKFNTQVAREMAKRNAVNFSVISIDNIPISIQFNYIVDFHEYNIQAGFEENFDKKLALGYLHFGYEIENAFDNEIIAYDFLAGEGKKTPYKERLTHSFLDIAQLQIIKKPSIKFLYLLNDLIVKLLR